MITVRGRKKCEQCGKRYNYYYGKTEQDTKKVKYKGKEDNSSVATKVKVLSMYSYEVTVNCPECGHEETFTYTD